MLFSMFAASFVHQQFLRKSFCVVPRFGKQPVVIWLLLTRWTPKFAVNCHWQWQIQDSHDVVKAVKSCQIFWLAYCKWMHSIQATSVSCFKSRLDRYWIGEIWMSKANWASQSIVIQVQLPFFQLLSRQIWTTGCLFVTFHLLSVVVLFWPVTNSWKPFVWLFCS